MVRYRHRLGMIAGLLAFAVLPACQVKYRHEVEKPGTPAKYTYAAGGFMRYDGYDDVAGDMEIASVDYKKPGSEVIVRLTGVIHIADLEYYKELQRHCLDTADVVLFEGVKFEGQEEKPQQKTGSELGDMYSAMGKLLGVAFQKDGIDYTRPNFVHCDITVGPDDPLNQQVDPEQMRQAAQMIKPMLAFKTMLASGPEGYRTEDAIKHFMVNTMMMQMDSMTDAEARKAVERRLREQGQVVPPGMEKKVDKVAEALRRAGGLGGVGMSPEMQEQILHRRNDYVIARLKERLAKADPTQRQVIAVFYGAAHMPGIGAALEEMGYEPVETTWLRAWRMNHRGGEIVASVEPGGIRYGPEAAARSRAERKKRGVALEPERAPARKREPVLY
ncbi:MAG: hypothetical protein D6776_00585 [Planctomycetota bacterium]|nr:MAG: hypothetical protein D6776_00585 [Planctomycetota bacterium]